MNDDLFYSILAMDAYHRGDASLPQIVGASLGNASVKNLGSGFLNPFIEGDFAAVAYSWNGKTIISYAGTNDAEGEDLDKVFGWTVGESLTAPGTQPPTPRVSAAQGRQAGGMR